MDIVTPIGITDTTPRPLAKRRASLAGSRVGVLDNSKPNADVLLGRVAELLVTRAGAASIRRWQKPGAASPASDIDGITAEVDVVLTGSAD
jgi:hypothetical protein